MTMPKNKIKYVNIGCGKIFHSDWINIDLIKSSNIINHNIKNGLPFANDEIEIIYHSHVLEHLSKSDAENFIKECYRILKPGGIIRIVVPDLEEICQEYLENLGNSYKTQDKNYLKKYNWNKLEMLDQIVRQKYGGNMGKDLFNDSLDIEYAKKRGGDTIIDILNNTEISDKKQKLSRKIKNKIYHYFPFFYQKKFNDSGETHKWMYDKLDLKILLEKYGFKKYRLLDYKISTIPEWSRYNLDKSKYGDFPRKPYSLFVEAEK